MRSSGDTEFEEKYGEYDEVVLHVVCGHDVSKRFVIRVVTYGRFDFTDDLRPPRFDASPKKGYKRRKKDCCYLPIP